MGSLITQACGKKLKPACIIFFFFRVRERYAPKRVCCCFDMCHYLFEMDADIRTYFCLGCPAPVRTITATIHLQRSSINASKRGIICVGYVRCIVSLASSLEQRQAWQIWQRARRRGTHSPRCLCSASCLSFFLYTWNPCKRQISYRDACTLTL